MAETINQHQTSAFTVPVNGQPNDAADVLTNDNALRTANNAHDADAGIHLQSSVVGSRPGAGSVGRKWYTTDTKKLYYDNGSSWDEIDYAPTDNATFSTSVSIGATPAATGPLRLTNNEWITQRNAANTADHSMIGIGSDDKMTIGDVTHTTEINLSCKSTGSVDYQPAGAVTIRLAPEGLNFSANTTGGAAHIFRTAANGIVVRGVTGSSYDFVIANNAGSAYLRGITGGTVAEAPTALAVGGSNYPATGVIRLPNNTNIAFRNAGNTADINGLSVGPSDHITIGAATDNSQVNIRAVTQIDFGLGGTDYVSISAAGITLPAASTGGAATMYRSAVNGLVLQGVAGSSNDFAFQTPVGTNILAYNNGGTPFLDIDTSIQMPGSTSLSMGAIPATTGTIRLATSDSIRGRNVTDTADMIGLTFDSNVMIGDAAMSHDIRVTCAAGQSISLDIAGTNKIVVNNIGIGFNASTPVAKGSITGSRGGNAALANLLTYLASRGDITDSTSA